MGILKEKMMTRIKGKMNQVFRDVFRSTSRRYLIRKLHSFGHPEVFDNEDMAKHFAHMDLEDIGSQNVVQGFIIDRIQFIESVLGEKKIAGETFIDIGDPDGIFIKALNKKGISANISEVGVRNIYKKGIEAVRCDAEHLPFKDNSIDHILFFEIFEHLPNPIQGLNELYRVANKSVILSIPSLSETTIHRFQYHPGWPLFEHHIFEFNDEDFRKIATHAKLSVEKHEQVEVFIPSTLKERCAFFFWDLLCRFKKDSEYPCVSRELYLGCFRRFSIYYLVKSP